MLEVLVHILKELTNLYTKAGRQANDNMPGETSQVLIRLLLNRPGCTVCGKEIQNQNQGELQK